MQKTLEKIIDFYRSKPIFSYIFIAFFSVVVFGTLQWTDKFADPDSFYHAKMAILMAKQGVVHNFPWLVYTVLPQIYTDHHFLYHVLLIPFVNFFDPLVGIKIATVLINTGLTLLFYHFLKSNKGKAPALFTLLLLGSAPFMFRISLAKANGLSLIFVMLILFCLFRGKWGPAPRSSKSEVGWLFPISFFYVWAYGGWPLGIFLAGVYLFSSILAGFIRNEWKKSIEWKPLAATISGSLAGLVIHPYFPQNLKFYWIQVVQIALVNYSSKIGVGGEWYGFDLADLISYTWPVIFFLVFGLLFFAGRLMKNSPPTPPFSKGEGGISREAAINSFFFIIAGGIFFVLTLKSCRNTEYSIPFMLMAASFMLKYFYSPDLLRYFKNNFLKILKSEMFYDILIAYIIVMLGLSFVNSFWRIKSDLGGFGFNKYREAMSIAAKNTKGGDIIFHSDWDDWPMLFYHNDYNRYIVGLDTTFMYKYSPELYKKWRDITWGDFKGDPYLIIKNDFHAAIIFIADGDLENMDKYFKNDGRFELLYDKEGKVYKVK